MRQLLYTTILLLLCACSGKHVQSSGDYTKIYEPEYAGGFSISASGDSANSLITVHNPWQGADSVDTQLLILRDGTAVPADYDGQLLRGNARRIVAMSSTHVAMLSALGADSCIVAVSGMDFISDPAIQQRRDKIADIGFEGNIDYETLVALQPDLVLLYAVNSASSMEKKLEEFDIPYMYVGDYLEHSPLGKAEWLVAIGEVLGRRREAEAVFAPIAESYNTLRDSLAGNGGERPAVIMNAPYNGNWFMPSQDSYVATLIKDAGGHLIYSAATGNASESVDLEKAYELCSEADYWLNPGTASSLQGLAVACPKFTGTKCFMQGRVYNNNRRVTPAGGNDYYESGTVRPDLILRDLAAIFHPELVSDSELYYYQKLN